MDLDHVDVAEHVREAGVGRAVAIVVVEHPADVGMVHLHQLVAATVPERQPLDLDGRVGVGVRATAVLCVGSQNQREGVLVVERQRATRSARCRRRWP